MHVLFPYLIVLLLSIPLYTTSFTQYFLHNFFQIFHLVILKQLYLQRSYKKCTGRFCVPFMQFPPLVTSGITIIQYQNQKISADTIHRVYSDFLSFTRAHLCNVSVCVCSSSNFITCLELCIHQNTDLFLHHKSSSCYPFIATSPL